MPKKYVKTLRNIVQKILISALIVLWAFAPVGSYLTFYLGNKEISFLPKTNIAHAGATIAASFTATSTGTAWTVPAYVSQITIKAWGAGGGAGGADVADTGAGGGGGFAQGTFSIAAGTVLTIQVGGAGLGGTGSATTDAGGGGGGYSAATTSTAVLIMAGGGGGGGAGANGVNENGGAGGAGGATSTIKTATNGTQGANDTAAAGAGGIGGTATSSGLGAVLNSGCNGETGGTDGVYEGGDGGGNGSTCGTSGSGTGGANGGGLGGGSLDGGGGGGGGFKSGGGGEAGVSEGGGGGGGGASFVINTASASTTVEGSGTTPGNVSDSDYTTYCGNAGYGGAANTTNSVVGAAGWAGCVVITYNLDVAVSGTLYADEGTTAITDSGIPIQVAIGTGTPGVFSTTTCAGCGGLFTIFTAPSLGAGVPVLAWSASSTLTFSSSSPAVALTKASSTSNDITGLNLYKDRIMVRHEGFTGTSTTIADFDAYDGTQNSTIPFVASATTRTLDINSGLMLYVNPGTEFKPQGEVTVHGNASTTAADGSLRLAYGARPDGAATSSILTMEGNNLILGGSFYASSSIFTSTSTVYFNASTTGKSVFAATSTVTGATSTMPFYNITFGGQGGGWRMYNDTSATNDFTIESGSVTAPSPSEKITKVSNATAGTIISGGTTAIDEISGMANVNDTLYTGTFESNNAEVYRYDGGTNWTRISSNATTTGNIASGLRSGIDGVDSMTNVNGTLYIGTFETDGAEVYRYDGGTSWTLVSQTGGQIASGGTTGIDGVVSMANVNGTLYIGTSETGGAEVYRYDGGTSWTLVSQSGGTGQIAAGGTTGIDGVVSMVNVNGALYAGTSRSNSAEVYRYDGGTSWTLVRQTSIDGISSMANVNGTLYRGTNESLCTAEVYRYDGGTSWTRVSSATAGTIVSGGTFSICGIYGMANINGTLYIGTQKNNSAEVYRYNGGTSWTKVSNTTAGTIASNGTASINKITDMVNLNGTLYIGTAETNAAEVYQFRLDALTVGGNFTVATSTSGFSHNSGVLNLEGRNGETVNTKISQPTAGTIASGGTTGINRVQSMANVNGTIYIGTGESNGAEVYRYDGGTSWTRVSSNATTTGNIASGLLSGIDFVWSMANLNGTLYIGTYDTLGLAEVYRYDGGTNWTLVTQTGGQIASGGTTGIDGVVSMTNVNGTLYIGTNETNSAEVYRYDGGTSWTKVSQTTAGQIASEGTTAINVISSTANLNGTLYIGTDEFTTGAEVYRYDGGTNWTLVSQTGGQIASGGTTGINGVQGMANLNGTLYIGTYDPLGLAEVYRYDGGTNWTLVTQTGGQIASGGTTGIDGVVSMTNVNGTLYVGTLETSLTEVYRYDGGTSWTKVSNATAGTIASGETTAIDAVYGMANLNGTLYIGTTENNSAEVYTIKRETLMGYMTGEAALNDVAFGTNDTLFTRVSSTTVGAIGTSTTAIDSAWSMENLNGTLYIGTDESNSAEVYRYNGNTSWTKVSQSTAGTIASGGTTAIDRVSSMANVNGTLYAGTFETNNAEVYRYDGGTSWTRVSSNATTTGNIASGLRSNIDGVYSMANLNGTLYVGTQENNSAEVYRYDGGTSWTLVTQTGGQIASGGTTGINTIQSMANVNGTLYIGTDDATSGNAEIYRYDGGTTWTKVSQSTAGTIAAGGTVAIDGVWSMANVNGTLYAGTYEGTSAEVYRYDGGTSWTKVSQATAGQIASGGTTAIVSVFSMANLNGVLYAGTLDDTAFNNAEIYRYDGGTSWKLVSQSTAGTIASGGTTAIQGVKSMANVNGTLYIGTNEADKAEVYRYKGQVSFGSNASTTDVTVRNGVELKAASTSMTIFGDYLNNGSLTHSSSTLYIASTTASQLISGNTTRYNTATTSYSTATSSGLAPQLLLSGDLVSGASFHNLTILNTGTTTFSSAASTTGTFTAATASSTIIFASGATTTFQNIVLNGQNTNTRIRLLPATTSPLVPMASTTWGLLVPGTRSVSNTSFAYTNACAGFSNIDATDGTNIDAGGNSCIDFAGAYTLTQRTYQWFNNADSILPGAAKAQANNAITDVDIDSVLRLRMDILVGSADLSAGTTFNLHYKSLGSGCSANETWTTVGASSSAEIWRMFDNTAVSDGTTLTTTMLNTTNVLQKYSESNSATNVAAITSGLAGEWDWVVQNNSAVANTTYCFRMATGTPFATYTNYPQLTTSGFASGARGGGTGASAPTPAETPRGGATDPAGGSGSPEQEPPGNPQGGSGSPGGGGDIGFIPLGRAWASVISGFQQLLALFWRL